MQESDKKPRHAKKSDTPVQEPAQELEDALFEEYDADVDEAEIPLRLNKNKKSASAAKKTGKNKKAASRKKKRKKSRRRSEQLFSDKRFQHKRSLFDILSASGEDSFFKPLRLFGHEIRFWPLFLLIFIFMMIGMIVISNGNVQVASETVTVVGLHDDLEDYNILVISDMNGKRFGDEQSSLIRQVESTGYDMILCVGDMVGEDGDPEPFYEFLDGISRPGRVYFIAGDSDPGPLRSTPRQIQGTLEQIVFEDWVLGAIERGATYVDAPMSVEVGETRIWLTPTSFLNMDASAYREDWKEQMRQEEDGVISGLVSDYNSLPFTSYRYAVAQKFYNAVSEISPSDILIGLSHVVPDDMFISSAAMHDTEGENYLFEPELIVSGHYCGGVWQLPLAGAFYVPNRMLPRYGWFPDSEDVQGLSQVSESQVFISPGISTTKSVPLLPFRLFNDPEITVLTLTAKLPDSMLDM